MMPGAVPRPRAAARAFLARHGARLPDLSGLVVLVPNHRAGQDFARALAEEAGRDALIPPDILPLKSWAARHGAEPPEPEAARLARLAGQLRSETWLEADPWVLAAELLELADALAATGAGEGVAAALTRHTDARLAREIALVEAVWRTFACDARAPQTVYARALDAACERFAAAPRPVFGYDLGPLTGIETRFLERCAALAPVDLLSTDPVDPRGVALAAAWQTHDLPLLERARALATAHQACPLGGIEVAEAPHLEGEAGAVVAWVVEQLHAGRRDIALIALDRETVRRVRALLERLDVRVGDETGWTLSTTAAAAVIDRWITCLAEDFPHAALLDLLKSPFVLGDLDTRQDSVLAFELALRRQGVAGGFDALCRVARGLDGGAPAWLEGLAHARAKCPRHRAPLAEWTRRVLASLEALDARAALGADAAGRNLIENLAGLARDLEADSTRYDFAAWRRWLDLALESASFIDPGIDSPIVLTALPQARGRRFEAIAVIGADARRLPPRPAAGLFTEATRAALGLPDARTRGETTLADLRALITPVPALFSWQAWHGDEPNPAAAPVMSLDALAEAGWGRPLPRRGARALPRRQSPAVSPVLMPAPVLAPEFVPRRHSASSYQTLMDCPYRFFVHYGLGLRRLDEADEPFDQSDYGATLHALLKRFHDSDPPPERDAALDRLQAMSHEAFAALPAWVAASWACRWMPHIPDYVGFWLHSHAEGWRYVSGETRFSRALDVPGLGEIRLDGVLDRVDTRTTPDGTRETRVIDYKTSAVSTLRKKSTRPDEAVQLPVYAALANAHAAFLPLSASPITPIPLAEDADPEAVVTRFATLLGALATGTPLPAHGVDADCQHCAARGLCRKGMWHG